MTDSPPKPPASLSTISRSGHYQTRGSFVDLDGGEIEIALSETDKTSSVMELKKAADADAGKETETKSSTENEDVMTIRELFRYATARDKVMMAVGCLAAIANGVALPIWAVLFGEIMTNLNEPQSQIRDSAKDTVILFAVLAVSSLVASWLSIGFWMYVAESMTRRIREEYVRSVLSQHVGWFDHEDHKPSLLSSKLTHNSIEFQKGMGEKVATYFQHLSTFVAGLVIGFARGWQLALLLLGVTPLMGMPVALLTVGLSQMEKQNQEAYSVAGSVADEALTSIKTVTAFLGHTQETERYASNLHSAEEMGVRKGKLQGFAFGLTNFVMFSSYGLCLWFGSYLIRHETKNAWSGEPYTPSDVLAVFFAIIFGAMSMGQIGPAFQAITAGRVAGTELFKMIDTEPELPLNEDTGKEIEQLQGRVELRDVTFRYPTRPDVTILDKFSLTIEPGATVAFVGESGSGKSTIVSLLERFYDYEGSILIDGVELRDLNLKWWREQCSLVSQEPVLLQGSVRDIITQGHDIPEEQVYAAAKAANAHNFITTLPDGYDTGVGAEGSLLSGGQKQRVAIARAIVRNPKLLWLDEATSALDNESERVVQEALDNASMNRTTIVIAHRLSTVRNADKICVLGGGTLIEEGTHDELMAADGAYAALVRAQEMGDTADSDSAEAAGRTGAASLKSMSSVHSASEAKTSEQGSTSEAARADVPEDEKQEETGVPLSRVLPIVSDYYWVLAIGLVGAIGMGVSLPAWSLLFADILETLFDPDEARAKRGSELAAVLFFVLGLSNGVSTLMQQTSFAFLGEKLTRRLREASFAKILRFEMGWFDLHDTRTVTGNLSQDASEVHAGTTSQIGLLVQIVATMVTGLTIAFVKSWQLALVTLGVAPLIGFSSKYQIIILTGFMSEGKKAFEEAGNISGEAFANMRTVTPFNSQLSVFTRFSNALELPMQMGQKAAHVSGIGFGLSQFFIFVTYALCFYVGAELVADGHVQFADMTAAFFAVVVAAMGAGQAAQLAPDISKSKGAQDSIFRILDRTSLIDPESSEGERPDVKEGDIRFQRVTFSYPVHPDTQVLKDLTFHVSPGQTIAFVGPSGSGKSTIAKLLVRFYDIDKGQIKLDQCDIAKMNIAHLRKQVSIVSQEPRLFDTTIEQNILYGNAEATHEEVVEAAKAANAHEMILSLPDGYSTRAGTKGGQLSGGQKQRIAIARALVRKPKLLILDEATSALDSKSEKVVQDALDRLLRESSFTTVVIAHRLSTIQNADKICVLDEGQIVESGKHDELLAKNGLYTALAQTREE